MTLEETEQDPNITMFYVNTPYPFDTKILTEVSRRVHDKKPVSRVLYEGEVVGTGCHHGHLQTEGV